MRTEDVTAFLTVFLLPMCSLAGKNIGKLGPNLLRTVELQAGILQNFVLATVVTEETARITVIAHSKHIFATKLLPC